MSETLTTPISITSTAAKELHGLFDHRPTLAQKEYLRVGVKGGGCSGMSYVLGFDFQAENDLVFQVEGLPCVIDKNHLMYLQGLEVDWHDGLDARGFLFNNPNASSTCGCGSSFSV